MSIGDANTILPETPGRELGGLKVAGRTRSNGRSSEAKRSTLLQRLLLTESEPVGIKLARVDKLVRLHFGFLVSHAKLRHPTMPATIKGTSNVAGLMSMR